MKIVALHERTLPIASPIANAYIDFSQMTLSLVALVTDVVRDGRRVVGYGFNSNGRYGQGGLIRERFAPRLLNADPAKYKNLLSEQKLVPPPLMESYQTPVFPTAGVPTVEEWTDALNWLKGKGILTADVSYEDSVNSSLLP